MSKNEITLDELKQSTAQKLDTEQRIAGYRERIRNLESEKDKLFQKLNYREDFLKEVTAALISAEPSPPVKYKHFSKKEIEIVPVLNFSDWQIGEVIKKSETEGFGEFNFAIARKRIMGIVEDFLQWVEVQRSMYYIRKCVILCYGDFVSGNIHQELMVTNEFPLPVQTAKSGILLGEFIALIAPHFEAVDVEEVPDDNHGRLQPKPQAKQKGINNMGFLVHIIANTYLANHKNVKCRLADGMKHLVKINGKRFLIEHGDNVRGQMGIPYYGFQRLVGKEAKRRMNTDRGFDYIVMGHWHVPAIIENTVLVNGCLTGTSEYDHSAGRHALPFQVAFLVHPVHGLFNWTAFQGKA